MYFRLLFRYKKKLLIAIAAFILIAAAITAIVLNRNKSYAVVKVANDNKKSIETSDNFYEEVLNNNSTPIEIEEEEAKVITIYLDDEDEEETERKNIRNLRDNSKMVNKTSSIINTMRNKNANIEEQAEISNLEEVIEMEEHNEGVVNYQYEQENNQTQEAPDYSGYYIMVNTAANVVNVYQVDSYGYIQECVKAFTCSTGTATPEEGIYRTDYKYRWISLFGDVYGQYATRIVGNILFHSVPYTEKFNNGSLEYDEYDKLGTSASMGCVRLTVEDAKWIYDNCKSGTFVEFYMDEDPGPLRKTRNI